MKKLLISAILIASSVIQAQGDYLDLKKDIDDYEPPSYLMSESRPSSSTDSVLDHEFEAAKRHVMKNKARWEAALEVGPADRRFFRPDPDVLSRIKTVARDDSKASNVLKENFSLELLETLVYLRNQRIRAAESRLKAAVESFSQVLNLDEILRQYGAFTRLLAPGAGPSGNGDSVKMKFPFPGVTALKGRIANKSAEIAFEKLDAVSRDEITAVRKTYWRLAFNQEAQKISARMLELLRNLESTAVARYETGKTSFQDVIKVRVKKSILKENLVTLRENEKTIQSEIGELLYLPFVSLDLKIKTKAPTPSMAPPIKSLGETALSSLQELKILRSRIGKTELMIEMTETMILPSYGPDLSSYDGFSFSESYKASKGAGLPAAPWIGVDDSYLRQTRHELKALEARLKHNEAAALSNIRKFWFKLDRAVRETMLYRAKILDLSRSALEVSAREYEAGNIGFADVIDSYSDWLEIGLSLAEKQSEVGAARAELSQAAGVDFNRNLK